MEIFVKIADLKIQFISQFPLDGEDWFWEFLSEPFSKPDVRIRFLQDYAEELLPQGKTGTQGQLLTLYAKERCAVAQGGVKGPLAVTLWNEDFSQVDCHICPERFGAHSSLSNYLRLLPMVQLLLHWQVLTVHASHISIWGTGILFAAPSGTGKSTQARLWQRYRNCRMICNDRTLIRQGRTYGYPVDGSSPIRSGKSCNLGAIVLLAQASENEITRLGPARAMQGLMPQLLADAWDAPTQVGVMTLLSQVLEHCPVYYLRCRPDEDAVSCLESRLMADGVIV